LDREISRLERFFGGIGDLNGLPDALFVIDTNKEKAAIKEATVKGVPVVSLLDSNCDPDQVAYPIPANDDAVRSIKLIVGKVAEAYLRGKQSNKASRKSTTVIDSMKKVEGKEK